MNIIAITYFILGIIFCHLIYGIGAIADYIYEKRNKNKNGINDCSSGAAADDINNNKR